MKYRVRPNAKCQCCLYKTRLRFYTHPDAWLCKICATTLAGNAVMMGGDHAALIKTMAWIGNAILDEIKSGYSTGPSPSIRFGIEDDPF